MKYKTLNKILMIWSAVVLMIFTLSCFRGFLFSDLDNSTPKSKAIQIFNNEASCSGVQVKAPSGVSYILTAGHCFDIVDSEGNFKVKDASGDIILRKKIAESTKSDLLLLEGLPGVEGLKVADSYKLSEHIRTFTHGHSLDTYKTEGYLIQIQNIKIVAFPVMSDESKTKCDSMSKYKFDSLYRLCISELSVFVSDAVVVPGSSGGMVIDDTGKLVAIVTATDNSFGFFTPLDSIQDFLSGY